jgi:hypothetical protein
MLLGRVNAAQIENGHTTFRPSAKKLVLESAKTEEAPPSWVCVPSNRPHRERLGIASSGSALTSERSFVTGQHATGATSSVNAASRNRLLP